MRAPSGAANTPDTNRTCSMSSAALRAAARRNNSRASAHTRRTAAPETVMDRLPAVRPSSGDDTVSVAAAADTFRRNVQLVRGDLSQGREDPLAELDLADAQCDRAVVGDGQPRRNPRIGDERSGQPRSRLRTCRREHGVDET